MLMVDNKFIALTTGTIVPTGEMQYYMAFVDPNSVTWMKIKEAGLFYCIPSS